MMPTRRFSPLFADRLLDLVVIAKDSSLRGLARAALQPYVASEGKDLCAPSS
jgi:hypothetical protein